MRMRYHLVAVYLTSVFLFDFFTKGLGGVYYQPISASDFILPLLIFLALPLTVTRFTENWKSIILLIACLYLLLSLKILNTYIYDRDDLPRALQYAYRFISLPILFILLSHKYTFDVTYKWYKYATITICIIGFIDFFISFQGGQLNYYSRARSLGLFRQVTSIFYEPAPYGMYLITYLFVSIRSSKELRRQRYMFLLVVFSIILTQSLGAITSLLVWMIYFLLNDLISKRSVLNIEHVITIACVTIPIIYLALTPTRVAAFINAEGFLGDASAQRRVVIELIAFQEFLSNESFTNVLFGMTEEESRYYRYDAGLVVYDRHASAANGLIELSLRYGILGLCLTLLLIFFAAGNWKKALLAFLFLGLITQIDGAIAKPWIYSYMALFLASLHYRPLQKIRAENQ